MRSEVADSWHRSAAAGVPVDLVDAPITLEDDALRDYRQAHPLARVFPLLEDVLGQAARECDAVMAVSDAEGQLLWLSGNSVARRRAEAIGFVEGSNWDERVSGTNAPGMALALDRPALVLGEEHFRLSVQPWSCVATPIHDPHSSTVLGVLDITGGADVAVPQTMAMVRAAARMAEAELARTLTAPTVGLEVGGRSVIQVEALGRSEALLTLGTDTGPVTIRLTPRHSEILVLLACSPAGFTGDELAVLLSEEEVNPSTLRAELNRLRSVLGSDLLESRPYRVRASVAGDWHTVRALVSAGDVAGAQRAYRGPLLPRSGAPGVRNLSSEVEWSLRQAVLASGRADLMAAWTRSHWGVDDLEMWTAQARVLPAGSPLRPMVLGQVARLNRVLSR